MELAEKVVVVDEHGKPLRNVLKSEVHTDNTPLHLAFSCYVLDSGGQLLLTRRALSKIAWPGVWTNSACGHVSPGEETAQAVYRRVPYELGIHASDIVSLTEVLPDFKYRAVDASGIVENELCPVFIATLDKNTHLAPVPQEVSDYSWYSPADVIRAVQAVPSVFSPWMRWQLREPRLQQALLG